MCRNVLINQDGGPDAPFKLHLITSVQPHKTMADKMSGKGKPSSKAPEIGEALLEGGGDDNAEADGGISDGENLETRNVDGKASGKAGKGRGPSGKGTAIVEASKPQAAARQTKRAKA